MAAILFHEPVFATDVGSGFEMFFYEVGTTTDLTVYLDAALSTPAPQPIVADSAGRFPPIYMDGTQNPPKVVLFDPESVQEWTLDEYPLEDTASLAQDVAQLQLDVEAVEGDLLTAESEIDQLQIDEADHETRITQNETDIATNTAAIAAVGGNITANAVSGDGSGIGWAKFTYSSTHDLLVQWGSRTVNGDSSFNVPFTEVFDTAFQANVSWKAGITGFGDACSYTLSNSSITLWNSFNTTQEISFKAWGIKAKP